jgi:hypothetical protein
MATSATGRFRRAALVWASVLAMGFVVAGRSTCDASAALSGAKLCRKAFNVNGRAYAQKRLALVLGCADKLLKCELVAEIEGVNAESCRVSAAKSCAKSVGSDPASALGKAALRFDSKTGPACQTPDYDYADAASTGPGGLWFSTDPTCGGSIDLPTFLACLRDEVDARMDALVSATKPRTGILFDNAGLGAAFSHLVRPPLVDVVVAATAPGGGTLVDPGTLVVPAGSALRVSGDAATLPCGVSSSDGIVTITVGTGPTAQQLRLTEPYSGTATFGPWPGGSALPYTIQLQDGACSGNAAGVVNVP